MTLPIPNIIIVVCLFLASCADRNNANKLKVVASDLDKSKTTETYKDFLSQNHLKVVRDFTNNFQPDSSSYEGIGKLGAVPDSVMYAFRVLRFTDSASHKLYLTIVFLKLYLDHLRCCHQSYEVRNSSIGSIDSLADPLVYEYNFATKSFDLNKPIEFISSGIADTYVEKHKNMAEYPEIKELLREMKPVKDSIKKHLYW